MTDRAKLMDCPFCGHTPNLEDPDTLYPSGIVWRDHKEDGIRSYHTFNERQAGDGKCWTMHCTRCPAEVSGDNREETIKAWNRRPNDQG